MNIRPLAIAPTLAAAALAGGLALAPLASADTNDFSCNGTGAGTTCQSPGNVQVDDDPAAAQFFPYGGSSGLIGGGSGSFGGGPAGGGVSAAAPHEGRDAAAAPHADRAGAGAHGGHR
jgi:hypothetical protein